MRRVSVETRSRHPSIFSGLWTIALVVWLVVARGDRADLPHLAHECENEPTTRHASLT
jgi:hypothetical protein